MPGRLQTGFAGHRFAAVVQRELRSIARRRGLFVLRTLYGALVAGWLALQWLGMSHSIRWDSEMFAYFGYVSFSFLAWIQTLLAIVVGAVLGVVSMINERRERTLGLLVLSQLQPAEVVLGKMTALFGLLGSVLLAGLPVYALVGWAGGLDYLWLVRLTFLTAALAVLGVAVGIACGLRFRTAGGAISAATTILVLPAVVTILLDAGQAGRSVVPQFLLETLASVPRAIAAVASQDPAFGSLPTAVATAAAIAMATVLIAARILPKAATMGSGPGLRGWFERLDRFYERINVGGIRFGRDRRRPIRGNPVAWLARTTAGAGLPRYGFRLIAAMLAASLIALGLILRGGGWIGLITVFGSAALVLVPIFAGAGALGEERARKTLGVLLATPLTAGRILGGKSLASLRLLLTFAVPLLVYVAAVIVTSFRSRLELLAPPLMLLLVGACGYLLALNFSLFVATSLRAAVAAILGLVAMNICYWVTVALWSSGDSWSLSIFLWLGTGVLVTIKAGDRHGLRFLALLAIAVPTAAVLTALILESMQFLNRGENTFYFFGFQLLVLAFLLFEHARAVFDPALGRSP